MNTGSSTGEIIIERSRDLNASPEHVFALLADPQSLASILPRVQRVDVLSQGQDSAHVRTHMSMGILGSITSEGDVRWIKNRELIFSSPKPAKVITRWTLTPSGQGTHINLHMTLDLTPMLGPLASFVPPQSVIDMIAPDLEAALEAIAKSLASDATLPR